MRFTLSLFVFLVNVLGCRAVGQLGPACPHRLRAVFDVGSGTTKMNLSEVATCADGTVELVRTIDAGGTLSVSLEAAKDAGGVISADGVADLSTAIRALKGRAFVMAKERAPGFTSIDFAAAGTHAFRTCRNPELVEAALKNLGVPIVRLTQGEEAAMGLAGTRTAILNCGQRPKVVWDVGGGSMQFTAADGTFRGLGIGAEGFKARVITKFHLSGAPACEARGASANPLGHGRVDRAIALAEELGRCTEGAACDVRNACVVGVGGLHVRAVHAQIVRHWDLIKSCACDDQTCAPAKDRYRRREVECLARALSDKTDCDAEVRGPYSGLAETNLLLVAGFMRALKIDEVHVVDVNLGQGLVVDSGRLTFQTEAIP